MRRILIAIMLALGLLLIPSVASAASGVQVVDKSGDGVWLGDTWEVEMFPGETKSTILTLYNSSSSSLDVEASVTPGSLDDGNLIFELDESTFTMPKKSYRDVTLTVRANGSVTPGTYTTELEIKSGVAPPSVTTEAATSIVTTTATLNGNLTDLGTASSVEVSFEWGTTDAYGSTATVTASPLSAPSVFSTTLSGLSSSTTYHFRAVAVGDGTSYGSDSSFTIRRRSVGGGGGGGPPEPPAGTTDVRGKVSTGCVFLRSATATSEDGLCTLTIPADTVGLTEELECLDEITMLIMDDPPPPPKGANVIGLLYDFQPSGATFEPPITLTFSYDPADIPEGVAEEDLVLAYYDEAAGEWIELEGCVVDPVANTITASVGHFTAFGAMFIPAPVAFSFSGLEVSPAEVEVGSPVTISALVENTGDLAGSYALMLRIDGVAEEIKEITLDPGASETVTFTVSRDVAGSYSVDVNGLSGSFTLKEKPAPPTAPPPPSAPPEVKPISWPVVGGIVAAVVIVGLLIFFLVRRRAY